MKLSGHLTMEQKRGYAEAVARIRKRCEDNGSPYPSVKKMASMFDISNKSLTNYCEEFGQAYKVRQTQRWSSALEMEV